MYVCVWPYTGNLNWTNGYTYISNLHRHVLAQNLFSASWTMDPSLNSTPMDLLNATEDSSPCNSTPMNRAHALRVSVGEARRAFARVQRRFIDGITTEAEVHMATYSLFAWTDHRWQVAHRQYKFQSRRWLRIASGKGRAYKNSTYRWQKFSSWL